MGWEKFPLGGPGTSAAGGGVRWGMLQCPQSCLGIEV